MAAQCVRLDAKPKDELDLYTALEMLTSKMASAPPPPPSQETVLTYSEPSEPECELPVEQTNKAEMLESAESTVPEENHKPVETLSFEEFERIRVQRIMLRLCVANQASISIEPQKTTGRSIQDDRKLVCDRRDHRRTLVKKQSEVNTETKSDHTSPPPRSPRPPPPPNSADRSRTSDEASATGKDVPNNTDSVQITESQLTNRSSEKLTSDNINKLCRNLYMMGFRFDEKTLRHVIKTHRGNVNKIIDDLSQMS